jgi:hypothetical protein
MMTAGSTVWTGLNSTSTPQVPRFSCPKTPSIRETTIPTWRMISMTSPTSGRTTITRPRKASVLYIYGRVVSNHTGTGSVVPFYLLDTIGGSDINSIASLRGFQDYRFRAPDLFYLQTQWERRLLPNAKSTSSALRKVAGAVGILGFYDAGQVALKASDFSVSNMRQSFGFGLTFWSGDKVWFRAYIGVGSGEGAHTFFGVTNPSADMTHL